MKKPRAALRLLTAALLCGAALAQQPPASGVKRFAADGLSFDYPAGWALDDKSDAQAQRLFLSRAGSSALIVVMAFRERIVTSEQAQAAREQITTPMAENLAQKMGAAQAPSWESPVCQEVGDKRIAVGFRIEGEFEKQPGVAELYALVYARRFINFIYVRPHRDEPAAAPAWKQLLASLRVEPPADATPAGDAAERAVLGGVLNGKVLQRATPVYPQRAKAARVQGVVTVQIEVDELGNVTTAEAVAGPQLLRAEAKWAVVKWKFTPTKLCGKPVKVTGTVTVSFTIR